MKTMTPIQIKHALEAAGYTQARVAKECEVSTSFISQVIKKTAKGHRVRCYIAEILNRPVEDLFDIDPNPVKTGPRDNPPQTGLCHN